MMSPLLKLFSLRRVKTWLRSTMGQERLDSLMVCHVHRDRLMKVEPKAIANNFKSNGGSDQTLNNMSLWMK